MLLAFDAEYVCLWLDERFSNGGIRRHDVHGSNVIFKGKMGKNLGCLAFALSALFYAQST